MRTWRRLLCVLRGGHRWQPWGAWSEYKHCPRCQWNVKLFDVAVTEYGMRGE